MFERKLGIFSKLKSKIPDFEREKAKIVTTPLKYSGTGIHTFKYFEDLPASGGLKFEPVEAKRRSRSAWTQRLGKITLLGQALFRLSAFGRPLVFP